MCIYVCFAGKEDEHTTRVVKKKEDEDVGIPERDTKEDRNPSSVIREEQSVVFNCS